MLLKNHQTTNPKIQDMKQYFRFSLMLATAMLLFGFIPKKEKMTTSVSNFENVLGTSMEMKLLTSHQKGIEKYEEIVLKEINRLDNILSSYNPKSELNKWQAEHGKSVKISAELMEVMMQFDKWQKNTSGALHVGVGELLNIWKSSEKSQKLPSQEQLQAGIQQANQQHWKINQQEGTAIHLSATPLAFNSFVKSYIIEKAVKKLQEIDDIKGIVLNIGGDIMVAGEQIETIAISDPKNWAENAKKMNAINIQNKFVATSGNYKRGYSINGKWYSHIIDPRTGQPAGEVISATVVDKNPVTAGALATSFTILPFEESEKIAANHEGLAYCLVTKNGKIIVNDAWRKIETAKSSSPIEKINPDHEGNQLSWKKDHEVSINFTLAKFEGQSRRPYVAVWVEDGDGVMVKTLAVWINKPRWLPDLREWYRKNAKPYRPTAEAPVISNSSATRPPGAYSLKWDGKNEKGEFMPPNKYTVFIEVAREHGTYQILKQVVNCNNKEESFTLTPNVEVSAANVAFQKSAETK
jgi:thiamine biosynthesis lipoprotein ApbE